MAIVEPQLQALRTAVDVRLASLEAALADPTRGDSLERLILDLSRLATDEAQATAARACGEVRLQADTELEQERAAQADLRQALDRAQEQIAAAGRERETEVRALGERFEAQLSATRTALRDFEDVTADVQSRLDAERTAAADLHSQLEAERASAANLRRLLEEAKLRLSRAASDMAARTASDRQIQQELALARAEVDALRADRENARAQAAEARQETDAHPAASNESPTDEEWKPVPLATRYTFPESTTIHIDGGLGLLCDLSSTGCQLLSPAVLKPNQGVTLLLPSAEPPIACAGTVVWARLEPSKVGQPLNYRAGVQFTTPAEAAIEAYAAAHGVML